MRVCAHLHAQKNSRERARAQRRERMTNGAYVDFNLTLINNNPFYKLTTLSSIPDHTILLWATKLNKRLNYILIFFS